jgi:hypothetical protein
MQNIEKKCAEYRKVKNGAGLERIDLRLALW